MKAAFNITVLAVLLVAPSPCFALWLIAPVSKERAKELGMEVRTTAAGPNQVRVELEFKTEGKFEKFSPEGKFRDYSGVELRIGEGKNPLVTAPLREDRSKPGQEPGRVVFSFTAEEGKGVGSLFTPQPLQKDSRPLFIPNQLVLAKLALHLQAR